MSINIDTEFIVDYSDETPKRLVRLTMDLDAVESIRRATYEAGDYGKHVGAPQQAIDMAYALSSFLRNVEKELSVPSLFSLAEFKATNPPVDVDRWL